MSKLESDSLVAFDIETDGIDEIVANVIGFGVSYKENEGVYIVLKEWNDESQELEYLFSEKRELWIFQKFYDSIKKSNSELTMWNATFDINTVWHRYGIDLTDLLACDAMLAKHTWNEEKPFGLKQNATIYSKQIGFTEDEIATEEQKILKENVIKKGGVWSRDNKEMYKADTEIIGYYCCADADLTLKLTLFFEEKLIEEDLFDFFYHDEVMPLCKKGLMMMRRYGVYIDVEHFKKLKEELEQDILKLTNQIFEIIEPKIEPYIKTILSKIKTSKTGLVAKKGFEVEGYEPPINMATGRITLARGAITKFLEENPDCKTARWILNDEPLPEEIELEAKKIIFRKKYPKQPHIFNLASNDHLSWLLFEAYKCEPTSYSRKTGAPKVDKESLHNYEHLEFIPLLQRLRKEQKQLNTYVKPILKRHFDGWLYPPMKQHGTTSGRFSCGRDVENSDSESKDVNLQTLPQIEELDKCPHCKSSNIKVEHPISVLANIRCGDCDKTKKDILCPSVIKKGFIAPKGYKVVNADFSSLEPRIFSWVSNDPGLKEVYQKDLDLYSKIAIDVLNIKNVSADPNAENFLKKVDKKARDKVKVFALAVPYGAGAGQIANEMGISYKEAQQLIDAYLDAYPELRNYMEEMEESAKRTGRVRTKFGRVRHLQDAKDLYDEFDDNITNKLQMALGFVPEEEYEELQRDYHIFWKKSRNWKLKKSDREKNKEKAWKLKQEIFSKGYEGLKLYSRFRNCMNNAKNFPIQSTAASVANASVVKLHDILKEKGLIGKVWIALQIHDEITCLAPEEHAEEVAVYLKDAMENNPVTAKIDVPMIAEPIIADNFAEAK